MSVRKFKPGDFITKTTGGRTLILEILEITPSLGYNYRVIRSDYKPSRAGTIVEMRDYLAVVFDRDCSLCDRDGNVLQTYGSPSSAVVRFDGSPVPYPYETKHICTITKEKPCTCPMSRLMDRGCTCGSIQRGQWGIR